MISYILIGIMMSIVDWMIYGSVFDSEWWKYMEKSFKGIFKFFQIIAPILVFIESVFLWPVYLILTMICGIIFIISKKTAFELCFKGVKVLCNLTVTLNELSDEINEEVNEEDDLM